MGKTAIPHIYINDENGAIRCSRCGGSFRHTNEEVIKFTMGRGRAWMLKHKDCKPKEYVS